MFLIRISEISGFIKKIMYEHEFKTRLTKLRHKKGVSAREMSISIGQNAGYINSIETGKSLPSMATFFYICEYLNVTPKDFFDFDLKVPSEINEISDSLKQIEPELVRRLSVLVKTMADYSCLRGNYEDIRTLISAYSDDSEAFEKV